MKQNHPLPIHHSWPLFERARHFEWGQVHDYDEIGAEPAIAALRDQAASDLPKLGQWTCDLAADRLIWSREVYQIFGFPDGARVSRKEAVARYCEGSRAAMETLRAYAIEHRRGFTLDVEIQPVIGADRWMRLIAAPVCIDDQVVKLEGLKFLIDPQRH